ncbi:hypothetical protein D5Y30_06410 [Salmonella enterica subsp. enterica serovar Oranienburg]|nr:hypothetical protein [Salmonella enterica subsp. enterica serovar Oranienburg]
MGQKFFDMHESSRLNMSFKCSGAFNIIYIMRTTDYSHQKRPTWMTNHRQFRHCIMMPGHHILIPGQRYCVDFHSGILTDETDARFLLTC